MYRNKTLFQRLLRNWSRWLAQPATDATVILQGINLVINNVNVPRKHQHDVGVANVQRIVECKVDSFTDVISRTKVYKSVKNQIDSLFTEDLKKLELFSEWICSMYSSSGKCTDRKLRGMNFKKIRKKPAPKCHTSKIVYKDNLMPAMCLVFWPYSVGRRGTNSASLAQSVYSDLSMFPSETMVRIQEQMRFVVEVMQYSFKDYPSSATSSFTPSAPSL